MVCTVWSAPRGPIDHPARQCWIAPVLGGELSRAGKQKCRRVVRIALSLCEPICHEIGIYVPDWACIVHLDPFCFVGKANAQQSVEFVPRILTSQAHSLDRPGQERLLRLSSIQEWRHERVMILLDEPDHIVAECICPRRVPF